MSNKFLNILDSIIFSDMKFQLKLSWGRKLLSKLYAEVRYSLEYSAKYGYAKTIWSQNTIISRIVPLNRPCVLDAIKYAAGRYRAALILQLIPRESKAIPIAILDLWNCHTASIENITQYASLKLASIMIFSVVKVKQCKITMLAFSMLSLKASWAILTIQKTHTRYASPLITWVGL